MAQTTKTALITGASAGLGAEYARLFAADKHDLVLVARRRDRLQALASELEKAHGIRATVIVADLGRSDEVARLIAEVQELGVEIEFLVNNAGFGTNGPFVELDAARELEMVQVNIAAVVALTRAFLPAMVARKSGRILNIGSTAGFQAGPFMAAYYAAKGFVNLFTEAIAYELRGSGVTATVSCPGATATEFGGVAGNDRSRLFRMGAASARQVAEQGYHAMMAGRTMVVHGIKNRFAVQLLRISPRAAIRAFAASLNRTPGSPQLTQSHG